MNKYDLQYAKSRRDLFRRAKESSIQNGEVEKTLLSKILGDAMNSIVAFLSENELPSECIRLGKRLYKRSRLLFSTHESGPKYKWVGRWDEIREQYPELIEKSKTDWYRRCESLMDKIIPISEEQMKK